MESIVFFIFFTHLIFLNTNICDARKLPEFRTILFFGDSTLDTGNNNYILTFLKSNHRPYGINFPGKKATGRFSDGKLPTDFVASFLGIKELVPAFLDPNLSNNDLRTGVNFASAGSGYDDLTTQVTKAIPVLKQPDYFRSYVERLESFLGEEGATNIINNAAVVVSAGVNDFVLNYYDLPTRKLQYTVDEYQDFLLNKLQNFIQEIYSMGCRWIVVAGLPPIGCLPLQRTIKLRISKTCIEYQNSDAISYNQKLIKVIPQLQSSLPGSTILYADIYTPLYNMYTNPQAYGLTETYKGCCGTGLVEVGPLCSELSPLCLNASRYMFFDSIHPTESTNRYLSEDLVAQILRQLNITSLSP